MIRKDKKNIIRVVFNNKVTSFLEEQSEIYGLRLSETVTQLIITHPKFLEIVKKEEDRKHKIELAKIEMLRKSQLARIKLPEEIEAARLKEEKRLAREQKDEEAARLREEKRLARERKEAEAEIRREQRRIAREDAENLRNENRLMREHKAEQAEKLRVEKDLKKRQLKWAQDEYDHKVAYQTPYHVPRPTE